MSEEYYIDLLSSSSKKQYPENSLNEFNVHLDHELNLNGDYKVGLTNVSIPFMRMNIEKECYIALDSIMVKSNDGGIPEYSKVLMNKGHIFPHGSYSNRKKFIDEFINQFNIIKTEINKAMKKDYPTFKITEMNIVNKVDKLIIYPAILYNKKVNFEALSITFPKFFSKKSITGIETLLNTTNDDIYKFFESELLGHVIKTNNKYSIVEPVNLAHTITLRMDLYNYLPSYIYIYTNIIEYHNVGDMYIPVLKIIPISQSGVGMITFHFPNTEFYRVNKKKIDSIYISIRDHYGNQFTDINQPVHLSLKFIKDK